MFDFLHKGSFANIERFLKRMQKNDIFSKLNRYGQEGVVALAAATPKDSGETAASWTYEITQGPSSLTITWINTHRQGNVNIAVILQYGHGTGTGGYVQGRDYINPATQAVFDRILEEVWNEVTSA